MDAPVFAAFPKKRPPLPPEFARVYEEHYRANRAGASPAAASAQFMEAWMHRQVAGDLRRDPRSDVATLELGAGNLNQLAHEPNVGPYDIVEPFVALFENAPGLSRVREVYPDIDVVPEGQRYDRITSIATFEHITDLPRLVARAGLLLAPHGALRVAIPSEGTWLWKLGWMATTGLEFRLRRGLDYRVLMRHEHVNDAGEIESVLCHFFGAMKHKVFGLNKATSLYRFYECRQVDRERCAAYLALMPVGTT